MSWLNLGTSQNGVTRHMKTESDGSIVIVNSQEMDEMIKQIKTYRETRFKNGHTSEGGMQSVGIVPHVILQQWIKEEYGEDRVEYGNERYDDMLRRKLNDPNFAAFRTGSGHIGADTGNIKMI